MSDQGRSGVLQATSGWSHGPDQQRGFRRTRRSKALWREIPTVTHLGKTALGRQRNQNLL